jgi:hypothetical protein
MYHAPPDHLESRIQNPLYGISHEKLMSQVEEFTRVKGFEHQLKLFQKAALLAQRPKEFENIPELSDSDREIIRRETTRKWDCFISLRVSLKHFI